MIQSSSLHAIGRAPPVSSSRGRGQDPRRFSASSVTGTQSLSLLSPEDFKRPPRPSPASSSSSTTPSVPRPPPSPSANGLLDRQGRREELSAGTQLRNRSAPPTPLLGSTDSNPVSLSSVSSSLYGSAASNAERKTSEEALAAKLRREAEEEWDRYRRTRSLATVGGSGAPAPGPGAELAKSALLVRRQQKEQLQEASDDSRLSRGGLGTRKSSSISLSRSDLCDVVQTQPPNLIRRRHKPCVDELRSISIASQRSSLILVDTDEDDDEARLLRTRDSIKRLGFSPPSAPLPSTTNLLSERERAREIRRSQKLAQMLGDEVRDGRREQGLASAPGSPALLRRGSDPVETVSSGLRRGATLAKRMTRRGSVGGFAQGPQTAVIDDPPSDVGRKAAAVLGLAIIAPGTGQRSRPLSMEFLDDDEDKIQPSIDEPFAREVAIARQREENRRRVAKVSRWLGTAVPPHLVVSGPNAAISRSSSDPQPPCSKPPRSPKPMSDAERGLSSPLSAQEHFHNVRRASKLASVFGQTPPRRLFAGAASPRPNEVIAAQAAGRESYEASLKSLEYLLDHDRALLGDMIDAMSDGAVSEPRLQRDDEDPATARAAITSFFTYDSSDAGSDAGSDVEGDAGGVAAEEAPQGTWSGGEADSNTTTDEEEPCDEELHAVRPSSWLEGRHRQHRAQAARAQKLSRFFGESAAAVVAEENATSYGLSLAPATAAPRLRSLHRSSASQVAMSLTGASLRPRASRGLGRLLDSFEGAAGDDPKLTDADRRAIAQRVATLRRRNRGGVSCTAAGHIRDD